MTSTIKVDNVVNQSGDNDSGLDLTTNDQVIIKTANTTAVTINSSQNTTLAGNLIIPNGGNIGSASDTDAISISSSGVVTKSAHPSFFAFNDTNDWISDITAGDDIILDATKHNIGNHYSTTTGKFTAPVTGVYSFQANFYTKNDNGLSKFYAALDGTVINYNNTGYSLIHTLRNDSDTNDETIGMSWSYYMTASQTMNIQSGDSSSDYFGSMTYFSGFLVG